MHDVHLRESPEEIKSPRKRRTAQTHAWYKRYPRDFWDGTADLTLEQSGAYNILIDWMYELGGPIPNDDGRIAHRLRVHINKWRPIRKHLFALQKLFVTRGGISNHRFEEVVAERRCGGVSPPDTHPDTPPDLFENVIDFNARRAQSQSQIQNTPTQEAVRVSFEGGKITLYGELRDFWLKQFGWDEAALELALIQAAGYVEPNGSRPLETRVGAQLAKQLQWARERTAKAEARARQTPSRPSAPKRAWNGRPLAKDTFAGLYGPQEDF